MRVTTWCIPHKASKMENIKQKNKFYGTFMEFYCHFWKLEIVHEHYEEEHKVLPKNILRFKRRTGVSYGPSAILVNQQNEYRWFVKFLLPLWAGILQKFISHIHLRLKD